MTDIPYFFEMRMPTKDCVEIVVKDPDITFGGLVDVVPPSPGTGGTRFTYNSQVVERRDSAGTVANVVPIQEATARFDRDSFNDHWRPANIPANFSYDLGASGLSVVAHTRQSTMRRVEAVRPDAVNAAGDSQGGGVQFEHYCRFHLDGNLPVGTRVQISNSSSDFPAVDVTFNDKTHRCPGIHVNCLGSSPYSTEKSFVLSEHLYGFDRDGNSEFLGSGEGVVDYINDQGVTEFYIIRADTQAVVSEAYPITHHVDEDEQVLGENLLEYASSTRHWPITAITKSSSPVITIDDTYLTNDLTTADEGYILYALGMTEANWRVGGWGSGNLSITDVTGNDITISGFDSTSWNTYTDGGHFYARISTNRAGTKVFKGDFSVWTPPVLGIQYQVYIPGLGVSRPFYVDPSIPENFLRDMYGVQFNGTNGYAHKASDFDLERPRAMDASMFTMYRALCASPGVNQQLGGQYQIYWTGEAVSDLPAALDHLYITQDAGDWDTYNGHLRRMQYVLRCKDFMSDAGWRVDLGHPGALTIFARNGDTAAQTFWAGTENLPDLLQQTIITLEGWRKLRLSTGEVYSAMHYATGSGDSNNRVLSYLTQEDWVAYDPSPQMAFEFAGCAADLGRIIYGEGLTTLGNTLVALAEESYDRGQAIIDDVDNYYTTRGLTKRVRLSVDISGSLEPGDVIVDATTGASATIFRVTDSSLVNDVTTGNDRRVIADDYTWDTLQFGAGNTLEVSSVGEATIRSSGVYHPYTASIKSNLLAADEYKHRAAVHLWRAAAGGCTTSTSQASYLTQVEALHNDAYELDTLAVYVITDDTNKAPVTTAQTVIDNNLASDVRAQEYALFNRANGQFGNASPCADNNREVIASFILCDDTTTPTKEELVKANRKVLDHLLGEWAENDSWCSQIGDTSIQRGILNRDDEYAGLPPFKGISAFGYTNPPGSGLTTSVVGRAFDSFWDFAPRIMYRNKFTYPNVNSTKMVEPFEAQLPFMENWIYNISQIITGEWGGPPVQSAKVACAAYDYDNTRRGEHGKTLGQYVRLGGGL